MMHTRHTPGAARRLAATALVGGSLVATACGFRDAPQWLEVHASAQFQTDTERGQSAPADIIAELTGSCSERLEEARSSLDRAGSPALRTLVQRCARAGLAFDGELRCVDDTLQVHCG